MEDLGENKISFMVVEHHTQLRDLMGNGQPGRVKVLEDKVLELMQIKWKVVGFLIALVVLMEGAHAGFEKVLGLLH